MSFKDILGLSELDDLTLSSNGKRLAYVVRHANIENNSYEDTLCVMGMSELPKAEAVARGENVSNLRWRPNSGEISYLRGGEIVSVDVERHIRSVIRINKALSYEWSPDGQRVAIVEPEPMSVPAQTYSLDAVDVLRPSSAFFGASHIAIYSLEGAILCKTERKFERIENLQWGPRGSMIGFTQYEADDQTGNGAVDAVFLRVWDNSCRKLNIVRAHRFMGFGEVDNSILLVDQAPSLVGNTFVFSRESRVLTQARLSPEGSILSSQEALLVPDPENAGDPRPTISRAWRSRVGLVVELSGRSSPSLVAVSGGTAKPVVTRAMKLSGCSHSVHTNVMACIGETLEAPPEIVAVDLHTGAVNSLTRLNDNLSAISLGRVEKIAIPDLSGELVTMYAVYPVGYRKGTRYPAIIVLYGFDGGFVSQAQYITSYAPQVWAGLEYVTLLWNYPRWRGGALGDLDAQASDLQQNPFAAIEHAVQWLIDCGLADPVRIGIAGHSMGSLWMDYAITHSQHFAAAASHSPGAYTPIAYWGEGAPWRRRLDHIFGGPPEGPTPNTWARLSPPLMPPPTIPEVREVGDEEVVPELSYRRWKDVGARLEMWVYPGEGHVFSRPSNRLRSLQLNTDWFEFWLKGNEKPETQPTDQYTKWREMRKMRSDNVNELPEPRRPQAGACLARKSEQGDLEDRVMASRKMAARTSSRLWCQTASTSVPEYQPRIQHSATTQASNR